MVKRLPAMRETQVQFLGREDPLKKEIATHSGTLAWKIPWTEEPGRLQSMGLQRVGHDWTRLHTLTRPSGQDLLAPFSSLKKRSHSFNSINKCSLKTYHVPGIFKTMNLSFCFKAL